MSDNKGAKAPAPVKEPDIYDYNAVDAPDDLYVNIGVSAIIIGSEAGLGPSGAMTIHPGDRRRGKFYADLAPKTDRLQLVKRTPQARLDALETERKRRVGILPPEWVEKARAKAKEADVARAGA